jgi:hypothetical protein
MVSSGLLAAGHLRGGRLRDLGYRLHADDEHFLVFIGFPLFFFGLAMTEAGLKGWR